MNIPDELIVEGIRLGVRDAILGSPGLRQMIDEKIEAFFDLCSPAEACALIGCTQPTLAANHVKWGLDKSTQFGVTNPKYFRSQIIRAAHARKVNGRKTGNELSSAASAGPDGKISRESLGEPGAHPSAGTYAASSGPGAPLSAGGPNFRPKNGHGSSTLSTNHK